MTTRYPEAFESVIDIGPLRIGHVRVAREVVDRKRTIAQLDERHAALISATVTGQLSVADNNPRV